MLSYEEALIIARIASKKHKRITKSSMFEDCCYFQTSDLERIKRIDLTAGYTVVDMNTGKVRYSNYAIESRELRNKRGENGPNEFLAASLNFQLVDMTQEELEEL